MVTTVSICSNRLLFGFPCSVSQVFTCICWRIVSSRDREEVTLSWEGSSTPFDSKTAFTETDLQTSVENDKSLRNPRTSESEPFSFRRLNSFLMICSRIESWNRVFFVKKSLLWDLFERSWTEKGFENRTWKEWEMKVQRIESGKLPLTLFSRQSLKNRFSVASSSCREDDLDACTESDEG